MNDLKQEYLDKKYSYLEDNAFNVKRKNSKKKKHKKQITSTNIIVLLSLIASKTKIILVTVVFVEW